MHQAATFRFALTLCLLLGACALGEPAGTWYLAPSDPLALDGRPSDPEISVAAGALPRLPDAPSAADPAVPRPAVARTCVDRQDGTDRLLAAIRPGVGSRLMLTLWSPGKATTLAVDPTTGDNADLPHRMGRFDVPLRLVASGDPLTEDERVLLATLLTANRQAWGDKARYPDTRPFRPALAADMTNSRAELWNALMRGLCVELRASTTGADGTFADRKMVAVADLARLCRALPSGSGTASPQYRFAHAFYDEDPAPGATNPCGVTPLLVPLAGAGHDVLAASVEGASVANAPALPGTPYLNPAADFALASMGRVAFNAVPLTGAGAPPWSLAAWEASAICHPTERPSRRLVAHALRLQDGQRDILVSRDAAALAPTHRIVRRLDKDGIRVGLQVLEEASDSFLSRPVIADADLSRLTTADLRSLEWSETSGETLDRRKVPVACRIDR